jgi:hypothetical protein
VAHRFAASAHSLGGRFYNIGSREPSAAKNERWEPGLLKAQGYLQGAHTERKTCSNRRGHRIPMIGRFFMMKYKFASGLAIAEAWTCLATAQTSQAHLSSTRPTPDPLKNSTRPLTEKSANTPQHRSSVVPPQRPAGAGKTSAELTGLERQRDAARGPTNSATNSPRNTASSKPPATSKTAGTPAGNSTAIDYQYKKPAGGLQAQTPNARSPNSSTPRVNKN